jgi:alkanesulfonate monooxygenase SsuD/methylene tetrahydromethanopterin reductase-like flavin-dependent oxidoreductase (luciferase family)
MTATLRAREETEKIMPPLRIGVCTDQHLPWPTLLERWQLLDELGFDSVWVADHLLPWWIDRDVQRVPWDDGQNRDDSDYLEGWTLLAALLARTTRIRGGILVSNNLFRNPALVAKMAATIDQISGGRFELGLGAGWFEHEHHAYGFHYPGARERVDRLAEALEIIDSLLHRERATFQGAYYQLADAPFAPRPVNGRVPILIGASGPRMLRLTARYADVWGAEGTPDEVIAKGRRLATACADIGRDPATIRWSYYGYDAFVGGNPWASLDDFRRIIAPFRAAGVDEIVFELPDTFDEHVLREIAEAGRE